MQQPNGSSELAEVLTRAKEEMIRMSGNCGARGEWARAKSFLQWAQEIDGIMRGLRQNGASAVEPSQDSPRPQASATLPYYYVQDERLVKVGRSRNRDGGTYEHRVVQDNFNLVVQRLTEMSRDGTSFETNDLENSCKIPKHEPRIVIAVLEQNGLLRKVRRGRWAFVNSASFAGDVQRAWRVLPQHSGTKRRGEPEYVD